MIKLSLIKKTNPTLDFSMSSNFSTSCYTNFMVLIQW